MVQTDGLTQEVTLGQCENVYVREHRQEIKPETLSDAAQVRDTTG